jgi:hypothetical protein
MLFHKPNLNSHDLSKAYRNNNSKAGGTLDYTWQTQINCNLGTKGAIFFKTTLNRNVDE